MRIEEEHQDVLQNIEYVVANFHKRHPEMTDYPVLRTYEWLAQAYSAEAAGRAVKAVEPSGLEAELLRNVRIMCEWRLGRGQLPFSQANVLHCEPLDVQTLTLCLKRLVKSVQKWNKQGGRQGYLNFMTPFVQ